MRIYLDSVRKYRNKQEWRNVNRATFGHMEEVGDGPIIERLCQRMSEAGIGGDVEIWRGNTKCFEAMDVAKWASGKALTGEQPKHLKKGAA